MYLSYTFIEENNGKTIYIINDGNRINLNVLGVRVGKFKGGIVIDDYIFFNDEILASYNKTNGFLIKLTNNGEILLMNKKAKSYFEKLY